MLEKTRPDSPNSKPKKFIFYIDFTSDTKLLLRSEAKKLYEDTWNQTSRLGKLDGTPWGWRGLTFIHYLRELGYHVDLSIEPTELLRKVRSGEYDAVLLSSFWYNLIEVLQLAVKIKTIDPWTVTILGGIGINTVHDKIIYHTAIDISVEGEAEMILPAILQKIRRANENRRLSKPIDEIHELEEDDRSIMKRFVGENIFTSPLTKLEANDIAESTFERTIVVGDNKISLRVPLTNIAVKDDSGQVYSVKEADSYPADHWRKSYRENSASYEKVHGEGFPLTLAEFTEHLHSFPTEEEFNTHYGVEWNLQEEYGFSFLGVWSQRGCSWGACSFCSIRNPYGRRVSLDNLTRVFSEAKERGVRTIAFMDDMFVQERTWVVELCHRIRELGLDKALEFKASVRVDSVDKELLGLMADSGFNELTAGVETFLPEKAERLQKTSNGAEYIRRAREFISNCMDVNIRPTAYLIPSPPDSALLEIASDLLEAAKILREMHEKHIMPPFFGLSFHMRPYLGSWLADHNQCSHISVPLTVCDGRVKYLNLATEAEASSDVEAFIDAVEKVNMRAGRNFGYLTTIRCAAKLIRKMSQKFDYAEKKALEEVCGQILANLDAINVVKIGGILLYYR